MVLKWCSNHKKLIDSANFYDNPHYPDGLARICKDCANAAARRYRERTATRDSLKRALQRQARGMKRRPYRSRYNPDGLPADQRTEGA